MDKITFKELKKVTPIGVHLHPNTQEKLELAANLLNLPMMEVIGNAIEEYLSRINFDKLYKERIEKLNKT